jgi:hypothetical protein
MMGGKSATGKPGEIANAVLYQMEVHTDINKNRT